MQIARGAGRPRHPHPRTPILPHPHTPILPYLLVLLLAAGGAQAADQPAFPYDEARTAGYLAEPAAVKAGGAAELQRELAAVVGEVLDGPWMPLYSDYSGAQAGGVGPAQWAFNRPGEYLLALSQAAPYLPGEYRAKAHAFLRDLIEAFPPTRSPYVLVKGAKARGYRPAPESTAPWMSAEETQRALWTEAYAVWAYASAFDAWEEARPLFDDLRKLRPQLEARGDFAPAYRAGADAVLTAEVAASPEYRFGVYEALLSGCQDNYGYAGARAAQARMEKGKPVFFCARQLAALIGYHRLAKHFGDQAEADWAQTAFNRVAHLALEQQSSPYLWSDPYLVPEVGRLLRDGAGSWLDALAKTANVGNLPATDWNGRVVEGKRDNRVVNPYTWYQAWGGQGEGVRPQSVMGAFLANALLFHAPAARVAETRDIPWCKADLFYVRKLVTSIEVAER